MKKQNRKYFAIFIVLLLIVLVATRQLAPKFKRYLERQHVEKERTETMESIREEDVVRVIEEYAEEEDIKEGLIKRTPFEPTPLPDKAYLEVQFICQAPLETEANWKYHEESCEEAALLMAYLYEMGQTITKDEAHNVFLDMIAWQENHFGSHKDLYSEEMKEFIINYYGLEQSEVIIIKNAAIDDIKRQITNGHPVIVPVTSGILKNPYYPHPGYHMLTAIGYTEDKIITNENGTRRGKDFAYDIDVFEEAMKDAEGHVLILDLK